MQAEKLYNAAAEAMKMGNFVDACPQFDAVQKLVPNHLVTAITVAQCYARAGHFVTANDRYLLAQNVAANQPKQDVGKLKLISEGLISASERISYLTVYVLGSVGSIDGVSVTLDGKMLDSSDWGTLVAMNQGKYKVLATAPGRRPWTTEVEINAEGKHFEITIDKLELVPKLPPPPPPPPPPPTRQEGQTQTQKVINAPVSTPQPRPATTTPITPPIRTEKKSPIPKQAVGNSSSEGGGVALMLLGGGLITGGAFLAKEAVALNQAVTSGSCDELPVCNDMRSNTLVYGSFSAVGFVTGTVSLITGLSIATASFAKPPRNSPPKSPTTAALRLGPNHVFIEGKW